MKYPDAMKLKFTDVMFGTTISDKVIPNFKTIFLFDSFPNINLLQYYTDERLIKTMETILQKNRVEPNDIHFGFWRND